MKTINFFKKNLIINCICFALTIAFFLTSVNFTIVNASTLSSFDLRDSNSITSVKNQGNANTCWAFAAIGAIESSLIVGGYADNSIDLSETHLGWFSINTEISNENDLTYGDGITSSNTFQYGGNDLYVIWSIARGFGLELEEFVEYDIDHIDSIKVRENERFVSEFKVTEVNIFENHELENIKKAIIENGALMASYFDSTEYYNDGDDGYSFFDNTNVVSNHATLIVGWDDNYSKENFGSNKPSEDGAWLCRNTRGESWGDDGYFWLSYETLSLKRIVSFKAEPSDDDIYQIYQYDGYGFSKALSIDDSGVIYTSNIFDSTESGILERIAFYTTKHNLNNEISVYQLKDGYSSPTDGVLLSRFNKYTSYSGYYLVDLPSPVEIKEGISFSIVTKISGSGRITAYSEGPENRASVYGKSYASPDGEYWMDTVSSGLGNLCIKAWVNPTVYEGPDTEYLFKMMTPISEEYYEDEVLSALIEKAEYIILNGGTQREVLNNYLRLACLYEKYYGYVSIENEEQFLAFSNLVNSGNDFTDTVIVLENDLDFSGIDYVIPSGFNGTFNGKFNTISGIEHSGDYGSGTFGTLHSKSVVKNIVIKNCSFSSNVYAGGISFWNEGIILDCSVEANINSQKSYLGLAAGFNKGKIQFCALKNSSESSNEEKIVYDNYGIITDCLVEGASVSSNVNAPLNCYKAYLSNGYLVINGINVQIQSSKSFIRLYKDEKDLSKGIVYTGLNLLSGSESMVAIVVGDVNSDGLLSSSDYLRIKSYFLKKIDLDEYQLEAADTNRDGNIGATDYLLVKSHFLNLMNMYGA